MKKEAVHEPNGCKIGSILEVLGSAWTMQILWYLGQNGPMRFGVLKQQVQGISARVLTERLRTLEERGFVFRKYEQTIPPTVTYGLTERMKDMEKVFKQLEAVAQGWEGEKPELAKAGAAELAT